MRIATQTIGSLHTKLGYALVERDDLRAALRDLCDKIALRMMAENPDQERLDLIESHKRAEALLAKQEEASK